MKIKIQYDIPIAIIYSSVSFISSKYFSMRWRTAWAATRTTLGKPSLSASSLIWIMDVSIASRIGKTSAIRGTWDFEKSWVGALKTFHIELD